MKRNAVAMLAVFTVSTIASALDWKVADDDCTVVFGTGSGNGENVVFRNNGPDVITMTVYNADGSVYASYQLALRTDVQVYIPISGSAEISDAHDDDKDGASGTYSPPVSTH